MRRRIVTALGLGAGASLTGCSLFKCGGQNAACGPAKVNANALKWLQPHSANPKPRASANTIVDVHAHIFNASELPVRGYFEGPVAHSAGDLGGIVRWLAPFMDRLGRIAPTAQEECRELDRLSAVFATRTLEAIQPDLENERTKHQHEVSKRFYEFIIEFKDRDKDVQKFLGEYAKLPGAELLREKAGIEEDSMYQAMQYYAAPLDLEELGAQSKAEAQKTIRIRVLAFLGHILSYRWCNLATYKRAFTEHPKSIGIDKVLASMLDSQYWLAGAIRSPFEDQMRVYKRISDLSNGYMRPIVSYNPWRDWKEGGASLALVREAIENQGFVGIKIYPPNGFLPWGNVKDVINGPTARDLDDRLKRLWKLSDEFQVPVMAHTNESMGSNDEDDKLGGPDGWRNLLRDYKAVLGLNKAPLVNLGHVGGSGTKPYENEWSSDFANLMAGEGGQGIYGDLGNWYKLMCGVVDPMVCNAAKVRLRNAFAIGAGGAVKIQDRIMFGTDWLMLSQERFWSNYPGELHAALTAIAPQSVDNIFGGNARRCFNRI